MRNSIPYALLAIASIISAYLFWELRAERREAVNLVQGIQEVQEVREVQEPDSEAPSQADAEKVTLAVEVFSADRTTASNARVELLKDPEYRKARLAQIRANQVRLYPGLAESLGLSEYAAERLYDLLAEQQLNINAELNALRAKGLDREVEREEGSRIQEEGDRERDKAIQSLLGYAGFGQWQAYLESIPLRTEANQMLKGVLTANGRSITSAQLEPVVTAAAIEQSRYEKEKQLLLQAGRQGAGQPAARTQEDILNLREASNRRILDAAAPYLTPEQLAALRKKYEQEASSARARLRSFQQRTTP